MASTRGSSYSLFLIITEPCTWTDEGNFSKNYNIFLRECYGLTEFILYLHQRVKYLLAKEGQYDLDDKEKTLNLDSNCLLPKGRVSIEFTAIALFP